MSIRFARSFARILDANLYVRRAAVGGVLMVLSGCEIIHGSGHVIEEERDVDSFNRIRIEGEGDIIFAQGNSDHLLIEAEDNIVEELITEVRGGELVIRNREQVVLDPTKAILFRIKSPELNKVDVAGSGSFHAEELETGKLTLDISGSGAVKIDNLQSKTLRTDISGSGKVNVGGEVVSQTVDISGSGKYRCTGLESQDASVSVSGSGEVTVFVTDTLDISISGSGDVAVKGDPKLTTDTSGSGDIDAID